MYRAPPPPPPPADPRESIKAAGQLQLGIAAFTAITFLIYFLKLALWHPDPNLPPEVGQWRGPVLWWTFAGGGAFTLVTGAWAALNWAGLKKTKRWARLSSLAFAMMTIFTCCYGPFGGFLLYLLLKREVKTFFDQNG
jgi:hypothetical protein